MEGRRSKASLAVFARSGASAAGHPMAFLAALASRRLGGGRPAVRLLRRLAMHIKRDERIRAVHGAHDAVLDLEDLDEQDLQRIGASYTALAARARQGLLDGDEPGAHPAGAAARPALARCSGGAR